MNEEVKVPEGVTIEQPKEEPKDWPPIEGQERQRHGPDLRRNFDVDPSLPQIIFPHYTNNKKDILTCFLLRPDGSTHKEENIPADNNHPVYRDIKKQFSSWELDVNTDRQIHQQKAAAVQMESMDLDIANKKQRADLWEAKQEYLKLPCMLKEENKKYKREIRKSQTIIRAQAFAIAAIVKDFDNDATD